MNILQIELPCLGHQKDTGYFVGHLLSRLKYLHFTSRMREMNTFPDDVATQAEGYQTRYHFPPGATPVEGEQWS